MSEGVVARPPSPRNALAESALERSPRARFLDAFVRELERERIGYCVLRGHAHFPDLSAGSDVDMIVEPADAARVSAVIVRTAKSFGITIWERHRNGALHQVLCYAYAGPGRHELFGVDVHTAETCYGMPFLAARDVIAHARREGPLWRPAAAQSACIDALGAFLSSGIVPPAYLDALRRAHEIEPAGVEIELARICGDRAAQRIARALARGDPWPPVALVRRAVMTRAFLRAPLPSLVGFARCAWSSRVRPWFAPRGRFIAFLGTDGSGKSTLLGAVMSALREAFGEERVHAFHWRPGVLPQLNALLGRNGENNTAQAMSEPHRATPSGRIGSLLRAAYYAADYVLGYWTRVLPLRRRSVVIAFDRYAYDFLVDPLRSRVRRTTFGLRTLCRSCPTPDRVLVCTAPLAIVRARKQELPENESRVQIDSYEAFARAHPGAVLVRTDGSLAHSVDQVVRAIFEERP